MLSICDLLSGRLFTDDLEEKLKTLREMLEATLAVLAGDDFSLMLLTVGLEEICENPDIAAASLLRAASDGRLEATSEMSDVRVVSRRPVFDVLKLVIDVWESFLA